jgi:hypothetical protein
MADKPTGFVPLTSVRRRAADGRHAADAPQDPGDIRALIRQIYFKTSKRTIDHDIAHAIELLKSLPSEEERDKAAVYMEGLAQMRSEWGRAEKKRRRT